MKIIDKLQNLKQKLIYLSNKSNNIYEDKGLIEKLNNYTLDFFPKTGYFKERCYYRPKEIEISNLPSHLRDYKWLSKMFYKEENIKDIPYDIVSLYVKTSLFFEDKMHEYELEIVKWQIEWMMKEETLLKKLNYYNDFTLLNYDKVFRTAIIDILSMIGIDKEAIEEGLEINSDMWFFKVMESTYNNIYKINNLNEETTLHKENWLKLRRYEYYKENKESVDKYGKVHEDMKLDEKEINNIKKYLIKKDKEIKKNKNKDKIYIKRHNKNYNPE